MRLNDVTFGARVPIDGYGRGGFRLGGRFHEGGLLIMPDRVTDWPIKQLADLAPDDFTTVAAAVGTIDILLLGTGAAIARPPQIILRYMADLNIGLEFMDTGAACRTYNVLLTEARRVGAALIPVP